MIQIELVLPIALGAVVGSVAYYLWQESTRAKKHLKGTLENLIGIFGTKQFVDGPIKDAISGILVGDSVFGHAWNEFEETLIYEKQSDGSVFIYNTQPFHEFILEWPQFKTDTLQRT